MKYLQEVTEWDFPNHTYIVEKNWLIGYIKKGTSEKMFFKQPMKSWSKSRRKFKDVSRQYM